MNQLEWIHNSTNIVDMLRTAPSDVPFAERVSRLGLCPALVEKVESLRATAFATISGGARPYLSRDDERALATEVLLCRHRFTSLVFQHQAFRQAALTVVQNIYLFKQRKIFFGSSTESSETERQEALMLFSRNPEEGSVTLAKTFQHLILARVWDRIASKASVEALKSEQFIALHDIVEQLNTLRNIYMILSSGLVRRMVKNINAIYRQSINPEDALQIGSFGIARAAYRYHHSIGIRFSTYASNWVKKEIQRQSLEGRLIKVSSNIVEDFARAARAGDRESLDHVSAILMGATASFTLHTDLAAEGYGAIPSTKASPVTSLETRQLQDMLLEAIDRKLSPKSADVIKRRYGLPPYDGREQSVIDIGKTYGVTRGAIYQLEQAALFKLKKHLHNTAC